MRLIVQQNHIWTIETGIWKKSQYFILGLYL